MTGIEIIPRSTYSELCDAFEAGGGCGHDLPGSGLLAIIQKWEEIRSPARLNDLLEKNPSNPLPPWPAHVNDLLKKDRK